MRDTRPDYPPEFDDDDDGTRDWVQFTKRTDDPKLAWLERQLRDAGIESRRHGESFHAPILQVEQHRLEEAWGILTNEIDDIPDDDERFLT